MGRLDNPLWKIVLEELEKYGPVVEEQFPFKSATKTLLERLKEHKAPLSPNTNTSQISVVLQGLRKARKIIVDQENPRGKFRSFHALGWEFPSTQVESPMVIEEEPDSEPTHDYRAIADNLLIAVTEILAGSNHQNCVDAERYQGLESALAKACEERDLAVRNFETLGKDAALTDLALREVKEAAKDQATKIQNMQHRLNQQEDDNRKLVKALEKYKKKGIPLEEHSPDVHRVLDNLLRTMPGTNKGKD